jgi:DNA helicase HerA-like ATPase
LIEIGYLTSIAFGKRTPVHSVGEEQQLSLEVHFELEESMLANNQSTNNGSSQASGEPLGFIVSVSGSQASVRLRCKCPPNGSDVDCATVGKLLVIRTKQSRIIGVITKISVETRPIDGQQADYAIGQLDLLGEIGQGQRGLEYFQRGVTEYPMIADVVNAITNPELRLIYGSQGPATINIGQLQQDNSVPALVDVDAMIDKHFAVFGTTGVGKSSGVALILRQILQARPDLRIFLIDPHSEYGRCFSDKAQILTPKNLKLPFWLFNFEEIVDVFFRGRPGIEDEAEVLAQIIPVAKANYPDTRSAVERVSLRKNTKGAGLTVDTPVPYRLEELVSLLNEQMGKLENRSTSARYHRLLTRIETARNDPRYAFMFDNANVGGDVMVDVLSQLFRLPHNGMPMTIMQLAGFPAEVVDSVVSVLCRMAFEFGLWSDGAFPLLVMCEEAHRYAPADRSIGFGPTRKAVSRIAKEGRKYGVFLGLVTQRPAELDATIISQCSTLFAMRMANDRDQAIVRSAVSDAATSLLGFVPSLGLREVFAFGEGVSLPTRLRFAELPSQFIPRSEAIGRVRADTERGADREFMKAVVERWRGATRGSPSFDDGLEELPLVGAGQPGPVQQPTAIGTEKSPTSVGLSRLPPNTIRRGPNGT